MKERYLTFNDETPELCKDLEKAFKNPVLLGLVNKNYLVKSFYAAIFGRKDFEDFYENRFYGANLVLLDANLGQNHSFRQSGPLNPGGFAGTCLSFEKKGSVSAAILDESSKIKYWATEIYCMGELKPFNLDSLDEQANLLALDICQTCKVPSVFFSAARGFRKEDEFHYYFPVRKNDLGKELTAAVKITRPQNFCGPTVRGLIRIIEN